MSDTHPTMQRLFDETGMQPSELAKALDTYPQNITNWSARGISKNGAKLASEKLGVDMNYILTGNSSQTNKQITQSVIPAQKHVAVLEEHTNPTATHIRIPRYDIKLSAGYGNAVWIVREYDDDPIFFRKGWFRARHLNPDSLRGMYIRGDSMEPYLKNYDTVIIDTDDKEIADGEVYAIIYKNNFYVKELRKFENGIRIISHNPAYEPMECRYDEPSENFKNLGRVVWRGG